MCMHGRQKYFCVECGGAGICVHRKRKHRCKDCRGAVRGGIGGGGVQKGGGAARGKRGGGGGRGGGGAATDQTTPSTQMRPSNLPLQPVQEPTPLCPSLSNQQPSPLQIGAGFHNDEMLAVLDGPRFQISTAAEGFLNLVHPLILLRIAFDVVLTRSRVILF